LDSKKLGDSLLFSSFPASIWATYFLNTLLAQDAQAIPVARFILSVFNIRHLAMSDGVGCNYVTKLTN